MSKLEDITGRATQLASQLGEGLKGSLPDKAMKLIETGAAIGAVKTGTRVATRFVRRNPAIAVAAAAGAGLLWYAARQRAKKQAEAPIEGQSRRVEAKRGSARRRSS
ncbi:hypothetical protein [Solilutibacter tolerans]|uniref:Uncharacterized protein n=1 Tax=Solilutibacter tolerans TaxID=1604334 RepID=A0A1N6S820_9GAMM|nr:hypothetical protein [Lysobacter tolerans]SIQ37224.1 hypothetical protein SAMN05421546_1209 [Lysobacter tolerans]